MISIISVYNKKQELDKCLIKSLEKQSVDYELILIDNRENKFSSAAKALNYGASQIKSESKYIMFVHQDVVFEDKDFLKKAENNLEVLPELVIAGVVGMTGQGKGVGNIKHGNPPEIWNLDGRINKPEKVQTLDECLIVIPRNVFKQFKFDEKTCLGWDLYVVDYCLNIKKNNLKVYVLPLSIWHKSIGGAFTNNILKIILSVGWLSKSYYKTFSKILKKYKNDYKWIHTTCISFTTSYPLLLQRIWLIIKKIKKKLIK